MTALPAPGPLRLLWNPSGRRAPQVLRTDPHCRRCPASYYIWLDKSVYCGNYNKATNSCSYSLTNPFPQTTQRQRQHMARKQKILTSFHCLASGLIAPSTFVFRFLTFCLSKGWGNLPRCSFVEGIICSEKKLERRRGFIALLLFWFPRSRSLRWTLDGRAINLKLTKFERRNFRFGFRKS